MNQKQMGTGRNPQHLQQNRRRERREGNFFSHGEHRSAKGGCIPTEASEESRSQHWYVVGNGQADPHICVVGGRSGDSSPIIRGIGVNHPSRMRSGRQGAKGWVFTLDSSFAHKPIVPGSGKCGGLGVRVEGESWRASSTRAKDR